MDERRINKLIMPMYILTGVLFLFAVFSFTPSTCSGADSPTLISVTPEEGCIKINEGDVQLFSVNVSGDGLTYEWYLDGEKLEEHTGNDLSYSPAHTAQGTKALQVKAFQGGDYVSHGWCIVVQNVNIPPTAIIEAPRRVTAGAPYTSGKEINLSAIGSNDSDGYIANYRWVSEQDGVLSFSMLDMVKLGPGTHNITLEVTDNDGVVDIAQVEITVNAAASSSTASKSIGIPLLIVMVILGLFVIIVIILVSMHVKRKGQACCSLSGRKKGSGTGGKEKKRKTPAKDQKKKVKQSGMAEIKTAREISIEKTVKCEVCNRDFRSHDNAYICRCGSLFHIHCVIPDCPNCGVDITSDPESVAINVLDVRFDGTRTKGVKVKGGNWLSVKSGSGQAMGTERKARERRREHTSPVLTIEDSARCKGDGSGRDFKEGGGAGNGVSGAETQVWKYVSSIKKPNICIKCKGMIKKGNDASQCLDCGKFVHIECSSETSECPNCGVLSNVRGIAA